MVNDLQEISTSRFESKSNQICKQSLWPAIGNEKSEQLYFWQNQFGIRLCMEKSLFQSHAIKM